MQIIEKSITEIKPYEKNPRKNDEAVEYVANSIKEFGFKVPIVIDKDGVIVAGHTRYKAAQELGLEKLPCIIADDLTEEQVKAFRLADNKVGELAEWDFDLLGDELDDIFDIDMSEFGFDIDLDLDEEEPTEIVEDEVPEEVETRCKLGDIWQLGEHFLICGDSTDPAVIDRLMDGVKADMVFTDPPYGMKKESEGVLNDNLNFDDLLDFNRQWIPLTFGTLKDNGSWYCWGIDEPLMDIYSNILKPMQKKRDITFRNLITWDKGNGQGQLNADFRMYPIADEKCLFCMNGSDGFYSFKEFKVAFHKELLERFEKAGITTEEAAKRFRRYQGKSNNESGALHAAIRHLEDVSLFNFPKKEYWVAWFCDDNGWQDFKERYEKAKDKWKETLAFFDNTHDNMNNVWHFDRAGKDEREHTGGHATPKPIALCSRAIKSSSREGEIVLDVFGGSGSTLIACEQLNRKCYMCELDPHYCDVIISRWENFTGKAAVKVS